MNSPLKIAIAGLGTVGGGVIKALNARNDALSAQAGRKLEIVAVSARNPRKKRDFEVKSLLSDPLALATSDAIWVWTCASDAGWWSEGIQALFGHDAHGPASTLFTVTPVPAQLSARPRAMAICAVFVMP